MLAYYQNNEFSTTMGRPYHSPDGQYTCLFDGELVNARILRSKLEKAGFYVSTTRLEELILALYRFSNDSFVEILRGKFAFLIFDHQSKQLIVGRDRYGIRPLYYQRVANGIGFASQVTDFELAGTSLSDALNEQLLYHYFSFGYLPEAETYLKHIQHVPAGCLAKYDDSQGLRVVPFADLLVIEGTKQQLVDEQQFHHVIIEGIQARISMDQMLGVFYTGQLHELVIATTAKLAGSDIKLFTAEFGKKHVVSDELAQHLIRRHINANDYWQGAIEGIKAIGMPLADPWMPVDYLLAELASKHVDVMFSTAGAGMLFETKKTFLKQLAFQPHPFLFSEKEKIALLQFQGESWETIVAPYLKQIDDLDAIAKGQTMNLNIGLKGNHLLKTEKIMAFHDLETRFPFLDDRILNVASFLTKSEKRSMSLMKQTFAEQVAKFQPSKRKHHHDVPLSSWIRHELYDSIKETFEQRIVTEFFDQELLSTMLKQHGKGLRDFSKQIWTITTFILWLKEVVKSN
ncbi:MAG: asparagine synthase-related protein [Defluviitaleaceae bacterium]|nr:asparagine synthase-related protein [Defluviitaleaceae bacterium]